MAEHSLSITDAMVKKRRETFLELLAANGGNVLKAALAVGYADSTSLQHFKSKDPEFARRWEEALIASNDVLEAYAIERGTIGVEKPIYYQGDVVGVERVASDGLLTTMLKARMPQKYAERKEISGNVTHKVGVALIPMRRVTSADWEKTALAHVTPMQTAEVIDAECVDITPKDET